MLNKVRVDKWLWSIRIFKTRSLSTDRCKSGKVSINDKNVKPAYLVKVGDVLQVRKEGFNLTLKVVKLLEKRVGAPLAIECYENLTTEEEMNKYKDWYIGKSRSEFREKGAGRPTKRDRRELEGFKDDYLYFDEEDD
ncbi:RNA-binding S4 domain-containing protein [Saprospiraceae bacterium]|nr:RNA-binding S4 domain-containing protein [Saprospiraceae bacterium]